MLHSLITVVAAYQIVEMEEETVPLAITPDMGGMWLFAIFGLAILLVIVVAAVSYFVRCSYFRKRIRQLTDDMGVYRGWNEGKLRDTVTDLELCRLRTI